MKYILCLIFLVLLLSGCGFNSYASCVDDCLKIQYQKNCDDVTQIAWIISASSIDFDCKNNYLEQCQNKCLGALNIK